MLSAYKRHTDLEGLAFLRQSLVCVALRVAAAIEDPDRVGLQLDDKLLNHVIDGLLADRHFDCASYSRVVSSPWTNTNVPLTRRSGIGSQPFP